MITHDKGSSRYRDHLGGSIWATDSCSAPIAASAGVALLLQYIDSIGVIGMIENALGALRGSSMG